MKEHKTQKIIIVIAALLLTGTVMSFFKSNEDVQNGDFQKGKTTEYKKDVNGNYYFEGSYNQKINNQIFNENGLPVLLELKLSEEDYLKTAFEYTDHSITINQEMKNKHFSTQYDYEKEKDHIKKVKATYYENGEKTEAEKTSAYFYDNEGRIKQIKQMRPSTSNSSSSYSQYDFFYYNYHGQPLVKEMYESYSDGNALSKQRHEKRTAIYFEDDRENDLLSSLGIKSGSYSNRSLFKLLTNDDSDTHFSMKKILYYSSFDESIRLNQRQESTKQYSYYYDENEKLRGYEKITKGEGLSAYDVEDTKAFCYEDDNIYYIETDDDATIRQYLEIGKERDKEIYGDVQLNDSEIYAMITELEGIQNDVIRENEFFASTNSEVYQKIKETSIQKDELNKILQFIDEEDERLKNTVTFKIPENLESNMTTDFNEGNLSAIQKDDYNTNGSTIMPPSSQEGYNRGESYDDSYDADQYEKQENEALQKDYSNALAILSAIESEMSQGKQDGYEAIHDQYINVVEAAGFNSTMRGDMYSIFLNYQSFCDEKGDDEVSKQNRETYKKWTNQEIKAFKERWQ